MDLKTSEKFILLAIHPSKGTVRTNHLSFRYGLIGAILIDLLEADKIDITNNRINISDFKHSQDKITNAVISRVKKSKRTKKIDTWISKLSYKYRFYKGESLRNMEQKGIIRIEHKRFLIIPYKRYTISDTRFQTDIIAQIREGLFSNKINLTESYLGLVALLKACNLGKVFSSFKERKKIRKELKKMIKDHPVVKSVNQLIIQLQVAVSMPGVIGPILTLG